MKFSGNGDAPTPGFRDEREMSLLVQLAANFIAREAGRQTLITPMRATLSRDRKQATVLVSVFPESEREHAITYLTRNSDEFRAFLKKEARFSVLPRVTFMIDDGEINRQHLDELGKQI